MTPLEQVRGLRYGLNLEQVRAVLKGWIDHPALATLSMDGTSISAVWDFTPPDGSEADRIRISLINDELVMWGKPADV